LMDTGSGSRIRILKPITRAPFLSHAAIELLLFNYKISAAGQVEVA